MNSRFGWFCLVLAVVLLGSGIYRLHSGRQRMESKQAPAGDSQTPAGNNGLPSAGGEPSASSPSADRSPAVVSDLPVAGQPAKSPARQGGQSGAAFTSSAAALFESRHSFDEITTFTTPDDRTPVPDVNRQIAERRIASRIQFEPAGISIRQERGYDFAEMKECATGDGQPGSPALPVRDINMLIPVGMKVTGVHVAVTERPWKQGLNIFPTQPPRPISAEGEAEFVDPDPAIYGSDEIYPPQQAEAVGQSRMRGNRFLSIRVNPLRYRPKSGELLLAESVRVILDVEPDPARGTDLPRHPRMDESVKSVVINAELMDASAYGTAAGEVGP